MFIHPKYPNRLELTGANLASANLTWANLSGSKLDGAELTGAILDGADLTGATLTWADLTGADLTGADLTGADLYGAELTGAALTGADLTGVIGLVSSEDWCNQHLTKTDKGWVAYKAIGDTTYAPPRHWYFEPQAVLYAIPDLDRRESCGAGVNIASTLDWVQEQYPDSVTYWKVLIPFDAQVVVPYATDGKLRASKVVLLSQIA